MLEVLAVALVGVPFNLSHNSLLARGLPTVFTKIIAVRVAVTLVLIPLAFRFLRRPGRHVDDRCQSTFEHPSDHFLSDQI